MNDLKSRFEQETRGLPVSTDGLERTFKRVQRRSRNRRIASAVVVLLVAIVAIGGLVRSFSSTTIPASDPRSLFLGTWFSTDIDGSAQTMEIRAPGGETLEIVVRDEFASVCSGAPSTMTGTGRLDGAGELVIPAPALTCDDGSEPEVLSPPVDEQLRNLTFVHDPQADALTDSLGVVWDRDAGEDSGPESGSSGGMWPQSSLEEVREAQERADADDPDYTWQVDPHLYALTSPRAAPGGPYQAEIFTRFLREELGWQEFRGTPFVGSASIEGSHEAVAFVRCAPGRTNPLYPNDPEGQGCAPTIDELHYETVAIDVAQLDRVGPSGIWVVIRWTMPPPSDEPITPGSDLYGRQVEQVVPPTDAEVTELIEDFLQARIDGEGAQAYLHSLYTPADEIPLLYTTTSGAPYERFEIGRVEGPVWPIGYLTFDLRLFADGGSTVVEQSFSMHREEDRRLGLEYVGEATTENGEVVAEPSSILDGQVTFSAAAPPWRSISAVPELGYLQGDGAVIEILPNSMTPDAPCYSSEGVPPPAEALVRAIRSDPDLEATVPIPDRVGGIDALRLDVAAVPGAATCGDFVQVAPSPYSSAGFGFLYPGDRGRLYILDLPEGIRVPSHEGPAGSGRTLTILITAPEETFDRVVEKVGPILESFEFHAG